MLSDLPGNLLFMNFSLEDFKKIRLEKQQYLAENSIFLDERSEGATFFKLYRLNDFYVELSFNRVGEQLMGIKAFKDRRYLAPYISRDLQDQQF